MFALENYTTIMQHQQVTELPCFPRGWEIPTFAYTKRHEGLWWRRESAIYACWHYVVIFMICKDQTWQKKQKHENMIPNDSTEISQRDFACQAGSGPNVTFAAHEVSKSEDFPRKRSIGFLVSGNSPNVRNDRCLVFTAEHPRLGPKSVLDRLREKLSTCPKGGERAKVSQRVGMEQAFSGKFTERVEMWLNWSGVFHRIFLNASRLKSGKTLINEMIKTVKTRLCWPIFDHQE